MATDVRIEYNLPDLIPTNEPEIKALYDVEESARNYEELVTNIAREMFGPDTEIEIGCHRNLTGYCRSPQVDGVTDSREAGDLAASISDWASNGDWLVLAKRDHMLTARVTVAEHDLLASRAKQAGQLLSDFLRSKIGLY